MLLPMKEMLAAARRDKYAVGAFDVVNLETCRAVLDAAFGLRSPVIVAIPEHFGELCGLDNVVRVMHDLAGPIDLPVATILDHGRTYESCLWALRAGMTSVMFDGSTLPLAENIAITREVVRAAHAVGVSVEGEVGHVGQAAEPGDAGHLTKVSEAVEFVHATGVDALAVSVGTAHGLYAGTPHIDYDLLRRLAEAVPVPLVLHGGSSTGDERLREAVLGGIQKVNIFTDMSVQAVVDVRRVLAEKGDRASAIDLLAAARDGFGAVAAHYMRLFGSAGRA